MFGNTRKHLLATPRGSLCFEDPNGICQPMLFAGRGPPWIGDEAWRYYWDKG